MLFSRSFYFNHSHIRNMLSVFGTIFNDIAVAKFRPDGTIASIIHPVPIKFANEDADLALLRSRVNSADDDRLGGSFVEHFPRMTYSLNNIVLDADRIKSPHNRATVFDANGKRRSFRSPVPYIANLELNIIAKNQFDALQIFEQIVPFFSPEISVSVRDYPLESCIFDMPISLISTNFEDNFEDGMEQGRRVIYTLEFEVKMHFYGPSGSRLEHDVTGMFLRAKKKSLECEDEKDNDIDNMKERRSAEFEKISLDIQRLEAALDQLENPDAGIETIKLEFAQVDGQIIRLDNGDVCVTTPVFEVDNIFDIDLSSVETKILKPTD